MNDHSQLFRLLALLLDYPRAELREESLGLHALIRTCELPEALRDGLAALLKTGCVRKMICSFPRQADSHVFDALYRAGKLELELVPQGNLAERIRAAGAGIGGFFTPTGYGTDLAKGKETREIDGRMYVFESPIHADFALIKAEQGDRWGNLTYRKTARNFGPIMAMAAKVSIASVHEVAELGNIDPEHVITPGLFVQRIVQVPRTATGPAGFKAA